MFLACRGRVSSAPFLRRFFSAQLPSHAHISSAATVLDASETLTPVDIVVAGAGGLDEMESELDRAVGFLPPTPSLLSDVVRSCSDLPRPPSGAIINGVSRRLLRFLSWCRRRCSGNFHPEPESWDGAVNSAIRALADMNDAAAMSIAIADLHAGGHWMDPITSARAIKALIAAGKPDDAVSLFRTMETRRHLSQPSLRSLTISLISELSSKGLITQARNVVHQHRDVLDNDETVARSILHGWCIHGNAKEARKALEEMRSSGTIPSLPGYLDLLRCVCLRNLKFNPSALVSEANSVIIEMKSSGVQPTSVCYNILLSCLCRARRVKEACNVLNSMVKRVDGCSPDWASYYLVIRVLYLTRRFGRGNRIMEELMREIEEGRISAPPPSFYHCLVGVLCGIEEVDNALHVFEGMKRLYPEKTGACYDLLIAKLCRIGRFDTGQSLWNDAVERGIALTCSMDLLDPSKTEVFKPIKLASRLKKDEYKLFIAKQKKCHSGQFRKKAKHKKGGSRYCIGDHDGVKP